MLEPVALLLAAGASRRFGGDKLLHPLSCGRPVALCAWDSLKTALPRVVAVVNAEGELSRCLRARGCEVLPFPDAGRGLGASIAFGVANTASEGGWLIALADMPFIEPHTHGAVAGALRQGAPLAAPFYRGRRGHPVGFSARFRADLCRLTGDFGAASILQAHRHLLRRLDCDDPGVLLDIDAPEDLCAETSSTASAN